MRLLKKIGKPKLNEIMPEDYVQVKGVTTYKYCLTQFNACRRIKIKHTFQTRNETKSINSAKNRSRSGWWYENTPLP